MTAETDAMRLVRELLALVLLKCGNLDPDVNKLTERAQAFLLAPAVQPAAGREEVVLALSHINTLISYADWTIGDESPGCHPTMPSAVRQAKMAIASLTAALAHPPAQGLEGGGKEPWYGDRDPHEVDQAYGEYDGTSCELCGRERVMIGGATGKRICEKCGHYQEIALSQPGPASEGDGE